MAISANLKIIGTKILIKDCCKKVKRYLVSLSSFQSVFIFFEFIWKKVVYFKITCKHLLFLFIKSFFLIFFCGSSISKSIIDISISRIEEEEDLLQFIFSNASILFLSFRKSNFICLSCVCNQIF